MKRITDYRYSEGIGKAFEYIPLRLHRYLECDFFTYIDPVFAGLHTYEESNGVSLRNGQAAHVVYPEHQLHRSRSNRIPTVILPKLWTADPEIVVHELGHVLQWRVNYDNPFPGYVSKYAHTNSREAFAEAFLKYVIENSVDERPNEAFIYWLNSL